MSDDLQLTQEENTNALTLPSPSKEKKLLNKTLIIAAGTGLVITIVLGLFIYNLNSKIKLLTENVHANKSLYDTDLKTVNADLKAANNKITTFEGMDAKVNRAIMLTQLSTLIHEMEGGVVTDDFTVQKIIYYIRADKTLSLVIDIYNQPDMIGKYKGKGSFDLPDRELRAKATNIINDTKSYYTKHTSDGMPKWDDSTSIVLTIKNYEIGNFAKGEFILSGEKKG